MLCDMVTSQWAIYLVNDAWHLSPASLTHCYFLLVCCSCCCGKLLLTVVTASRTTAKG
jgi:hypothetical protein